MYGGVSFRVITLIKKRRSVYGGVSFRVITLINFFVRIHGGVSFFARVIKYLG